MSGPLDGYRIIDLTKMVSGPLATSILGDQGADVIKVEVPGSGDHTRSVGNKQNGMSSSFLNINRSKRSVTLNLKDERGKTALKKIAATADVVVQNFRPGVVERLGIGFDDIKTVVPNIVYVSISGFGERGPWAGRPVYDPIIQALSGLTTIQAGSDSERPRLVRTIVPDKLTAVVASQAVTAALLARAKSGEGQHVRVSMLDAVMNFLWGSDMNGLTFPDQTIKAQAAASFIDLIYETADGFMTVSTMGNKEWTALTRAFDEPELLEDPRFKTAALRDKNVNERLQLIQDRLIKRTTAEWIEVFEREGVPCAPALTRAEAIEHPQVVASEIVVEKQHPIAGRVRQARTAARFESTPADEWRGAPRLGEDNVEVLREVGYGDKEIAEFTRDGVIGAQPD